MQILSIQRLMLPETILKAEHCPSFDFYKIILGLLRKENTCNVILNVLAAYATYIYLVHAFIKSGSCLDKFMPFTRTAADI